MSNLHPIEQHIIEVTGFVPEKQYRKRQSLLGAYLVAVCDLPDEIYNEKLSEEAADWSIKAAAVNKLNKNRSPDKALPLPDFGEVAHENGHDETSGEETEVGEDEGSETDTVSEAVGDDDQGTSDEEPKKAPKKRGKAKVKVAKAPKAPKEPKEPKVKKSPRGANDWGVALNTKSDLVCRMLAQEGGTTMKDIKEATGQTHYNLVNRLARHGHNLGFAIEKNGENLRLVNKE